MGIAPIQFRMVIIKLKVRFGIIHFARTLNGRKKANNLIPYTHARVQIRG